MIGYYAHHHGRGHLTRAAAIIAALGDDATVLSSGSYDGPGELFELPLDEGDASANPTANETLHWAPHGSPGLSERMALITRWIADARPSAFVVDVSVEVAMLARLCGVPTVVIAMPGERGDRPHQLAYGAADRIIATWPRGVNEPAWLTEHADRVAYVGGISRFEGRAAPAEISPRRVVVLGGRGGTTVTAEAVSAAAAASPGWEWTPIGVAGAPWVDDPFELLSTAEVVVSASGQSSIADLAVAGRPAIVICEDRPYGEQRATGDALTAAGLATVLDRWPTPDRWPALLDGVPSPRWEAWQTAGAARRAAAVIKDAGGLAR